MNRFLLLLLFFCLLTGCQPSGTSTRTAFYHWKTHAELGSLELGTLNQLAAERLYVKYFDLDWDEQRNQAVPLASVQWGDSLPTNLDIVPVIFITTRVLKQLGDHDLPAVVQKMAQHIGKLHPPERNFTHIQLDCDWTPSTKERFFTLVRSLRKAFPRSVIWSATIRLHQIRDFRQTGTPPVDRGMLMFYNMGSLRSWDEPNAILNLDIARAYMTEAVDAYPLPLDVAFPLYHWGATFRRGELTYLINGLKEESLTDTSRFHFLSKGRYEVVKNTYLNSYYLYSGDRIRLDRATPATVQQAAREVAEWLPKKPGHVALYHLDESVLASWTYDELTQICRPFD